MHKYELVCIIHPDQDEAAFNAIVEKVKGWIVEASGTVDKVDVWGRKRLAYPIHKQAEGLFVLFNISLPPAGSKSLDHNLRFLESVIRYMITVVD
ncbi:MAG: 30S ribosomal protein S6 [Chloroflexota bacterium]